MVPDVRAAKRAVRAASSSAPGCLLALSMLQDIASNGTWGKRDRFCGAAPIVPCCLTDGAQLRPKEDVLHTSILASSGTRLLSTGCQGLQPCTQPRWESQAGKDMAESMGSGCPLQPGNHLLAQQADGHEGPLEIVVPAAKQVSATSSSQELQICSASWDAVA